MTTTHNRSTLDQKKAAARTAYKTAKETYMREPNNENWIAFCMAKRECMMLGVII